jgi:hypothetical protein
LGRARGPDPTRVGPAARPAKAHRPRQAMAAAARAPRLVLRRCRSSEPRRPWCRTGTPSGEVDAARKTAPLSRVAVAGHHPYLIVEHPCRKDPSTTVVRLNRAVWPPCLKFQPEHHVLPIGECKIPSHPLSLVPPNASHPKIPRSARNSVRRRPWRS